VAGLVAALATATLARPVDAPALYGTACAPCHGKDGKGRTPAGKKVGAKDLGASRLADAEIARQIREGRRDSRGRQQMPAFGDTLSEAEIQALIELVKRFRAVPQPGQ
jgi:mono/diheme cytochrome c family protein